MVFRPLKLFQEAEGFGISKLIEKSRWSRIQKSQFEMTPFLDSFTVSPQTEAAIVIETVCIKHVKNSESLDVVTPTISSCE